MLLVGLLSIAVWWSKKRVKISYFLFGGLIWISAVIPKLVMDMTITSPLSFWANTTFGLTGLLAIMSAYVGLRTSAFECGFSYLFFSKSKPREMSSDEVIAFGIGFGASEAILLAIPSIVQMVMFILNPSILEALPPQMKQATEAQLNMPTWVVLAPVMERAFVLLVHIFASLLIFRSVSDGKLAPFLGAFVYKGVLDGAIPYLQWIFKPSISPEGAYFAEVWVALMATIALAGIRRIRIH